MTEIFLPGIALVVCLLLDLLVAASKVAFNQLSHARLLGWRERTGATVDRTVSLLSGMSNVQASLDFILVVARLALAGFTIWLVLLYGRHASWAYAALGLLLLAITLFWLEWFVGRMVSRQPERWAIHLSDFVRVLRAICAIVLFPLYFWRNNVPKMSTEDELKSLVDTGQEEGVFEQGERRMIYSIIELGDTLVRQIMVPRIDMLALDVDTPLPEAVDAMLQSGHSRVPVYEGTVDKTLGLLYAKDLLRVWREGENSCTLRELLRPAYFVPEAKKADELLAEMQAQRIHMAIVFDEYGGVAGLVTLEDIVEEILGEIQDEYDQAEEAPYQKLADGSYLFQGRIELSDFNEIMNSNLPSDEADTLGGYIYNYLGRVPSVGEKLQEGNLLLTVEQVSARRIRKVNARWLLTNHQEEEARVDR